MSVQVELWGLQAGLRDGHPRYWVEVKGRREGELGHIWFSVPRSCWRANLFTGATCY